MTLRHLRIFLSVCDHGCSTTKAADALHITQPAVSLAIRELESHYKVSFFERVGRRLVLNDSGQRLRQYALQITALFDAMEDELCAPRTASLRIGASITIGSHFLPSYVRIFQEQHPGVKLHVEVGDSHMLEEDLLAGKLDLALMEGRPHSPLILAESYMQDDLVVIGANNGQFQSGEHITLKEFPQQPFLLRERGSGAREEFERVAKQAGLSVSPMWVSISTGALIHAVSCGLGLSVLPYRMVQDAVRLGQVVILTVDGLAFERRFWIARHKSKCISPACDDFIRLCRDHAAQERIVRPE